jgi:sugar O-acyltransferase (sialic acid O-acetyltransferase NeuD family)
MNLIFVGGGGFYNEIRSYFEVDKQAGLHASITVKGVLDDNPYNNPGSQTNDEYLGQIDKYQPQSDDRFLISIGSPQHRARIHQLLVAKGAEFLSYIHPSCHIASSATIGAGVILCANSIVSTNSVIEHNVAVNVFCSIGHDCRVGAHSVLSPYCAVNGAAVVGSECFLATRVTMFPSAELGSQSIVDCHGYVKGKVAAKQMVSVRAQYSVVNNRLLR